MHRRKYLSLATTLSVNCLSSTSRSWGQVYDLTAGIANKCISVTSNGSSFLNTSFRRRHFLVLRKLRQSRIFAKHMRKETRFSERDITIYCFIIAKEDSRHVWRQTALIQLQRNFFNVDTMSNWQPMVSKFKRDLKFIYFYLVSLLLFDFSLFLFSELFLQILLRFLENCYKTKFKDEWSFNLKTKILKESLFILYIIIFKIQNL